MKDSLYTNIRIMIHVLDNANYLHSLPIHYNE